MSKKEELGSEEQVISTEEQTNKKQKWKVILVGIFLLAAIAIGLYIGYKKLNSNPVSIYKTAITDTYNDLNNALKEKKKNDFSSFNFKTDPVTMNLEAKLDSNMEELKNFAGLTYNLSTSLDYANEKLYGSIGIKEGNNTIISGELSYENNNIYLKSKELLDKVLRIQEYDLFKEISSNIDIDDINLILSYDNMEYILKSMKDILIESLDKDKFTIENENITIGSKEYKAKKVIYNLDEENIKRTAKFFSESILKDEKLLNALAETTGLSVEKIKEEITFDESTINYSPIKIVLYTDGFNNIIAGAVYEAEKEIIKFEDDKNLNLVIKIEDSVLTLSKENDDIKVVLSENKEEIITLKFIEEKNGTKIDYNLILDGTPVTGTIEVNNPNKEDDKHISADFKLSMNTTVLGKEINVSLNGTIEVAKEMNITLDTTNSKDIKELTESEMTEVYTNLNKILERLGLMELLTNL